MSETQTEHDVILIGAGLAGLSLARQLLLETDKTVLVLDRSPVVPVPRQKVGEATVQCSGYYFGRVLGLEEYLLREHYLKYNLRFYWKSPGRDNAAFEDFSQSYIRGLSNIPTYQLDRNKIEEELARRNRECERYTLLHPVSDVTIEVAADDGPHTVRYRREGRQHTAHGKWLVDTSGRSRLLAHKLGLTMPSEIHHGAAFLWVEGLLDITELTGRSRREQRLAPERRALGHLPFWLATNHFCGEGFWLWTIPLQGKTSIGVVFDNRYFPKEEVASAAGLVDWICREFPLFARDLPRRKVLDYAGYRSFAHDCKRTIDAQRWAMSGEAGRFADPLYSPGGDIISLYNTLIADAIATADPEELAAKAPLYDRAMRAFYDAYVPSFAISYQTLGDPESFTLRYVWELTIYFAFYVFPLINDLFVDRRFMPSFLGLFAQLGPLNRRLHELLEGYYFWQKAHLRRPAEPVYFEFTELPALPRAEKLFYQVGVGREEALGLLTGQLASLRELARFVAAHLAAVVAGEPALVRRRAFVEGIDLRVVTFDPDAFAALAARARAAGDELYEWTFDPGVMDRYRTEPAVPAKAASGAA